MNSRKLLALLSLMLVCTGRTDAQGPMLVVLIGAATGLLTKLMVSISKSDELCNGPWISFDEKGLKADLETRLIGQHIASGVIMNAVTEFMKNDNPKKPLVLSFHGMSGIGKNLASQLIVKNIYKEGMDSRFVHLFISTVHFPHKGQVETYKSQLQQWIRGNVTNCARSMFIFDEMDKMHPGLIDSIKPFMDYRYKLDGVSYRKAIFIFLSNAGGEIITQTTLDFWKTGKDRKELKLKDVETALSASVFNNKNSGLWHSSLIESSLVDCFIPFLPLERQHVVQCFLVEMKAMGLQPDHNLARQMAKEFYYFPKDERVFSVPGCKKISSRLMFYI